MPGLSPGPSRRATASRLSGGPVRADSSSPGDAVEPAHTSVPFPVVLPIPFAHAGSRRDALYIVPGYRRGSLANDGNPDAIRLAMAAPVAPFVAFVRGPRSVVLCPPARGLAHQSRAVVERLDPRPGSPQSAVVNRRARTADRNDVIIVADGVTDLRIAHRDVIPKDQGFRAGTAAIQSFATGLARPHNRFSGGITHHDAD